MGGQATGAFAALTPQILAVVVPASLAIAAMFAALGVQLRRRRRAAAAWAALVLGLALGGFVAARVDGRLHRALALATLGLCAVNAVRFQGLARAAAAVGSAGWAAALLAARALFR